jgi:hypothetical protein
VWRVRSHALQTNTAIKTRVRAQYLGCAGLSGLLAVRLRTAHITITHQHTPHQHVIHHNTLAHMCVSPLPVMRCNSDVPSSSDTRDDELDDDDDDDDGDDERDDDRDDDVDE